MINQFTGCSMKTLRRRLKNTKQDLEDFLNDPDAGGGGSPTEGMRERIEDLEQEIERRGEKP